MAYAQSDCVAMYNGDVILYATSWCGDCQEMRNFLKKEGIPHIEFDSEKSERANAEYKSLGGRGVPLLVLKSALVKGYNPRAVIEEVRFAGKYDLTSL